MDSLNEHAAERRAKRRRDVILGTAIVVGPPAALIAFFQFDIWGLLAQPSSFAGLLLASYVLGFIPATIGGAIAGWICIHVRNVALQLVCCTLTGAAIATLANCILPVLTANLFAREMPNVLDLQAVIWWGSVGATAALVSIVAAAAIDHLLNLPD